jgi:hypothetical protein
VPPSAKRRRVLMNVCKLRVTGAVDARAVAQVRWELFVFPEIRDVLPTLEPETVAVLWEGSTADPERWCRALARAGYEADPVEPPSALEDRQPAA